MSLFPCHLPLSGSLRTRLVEFETQVWNHWSRCEVMTDLVILRAASDKYSEYSHLSTLKENIPFQNIYALVFVGTDWV
jgi:hypothetical protein